jgi:hypothetical protein
MQELFGMAMWAANTAHIAFSARLAPAMKKFRQGLLPLTLVLVGFAPFSQAHSMPGPAVGGSATQERVRIAEAFRDGISLDEAVRRAEAQYRARVVRTDVQDEDGRKVYVLKLLSEDGRVVTVRIDASTGRMR